MFGDDLKADGFSRQEDAFLLKIIDSLPTPGTGKGQKFSDVKISLIAYKKAHDDFKKNEEELKNSTDLDKIDFTAVVDEGVDIPAVVAVKKKYVELNAALLDAHSACWKELTTSFSQFLESIEEAKICLTTRILSILESFAEQNIPFDWELIFGDYFNRWSEEHKKMIYRYHSYHQLVVEMKGNTKHPHFATHVAIHEQKYKLLRQEKNHKTGRLKFDNIPLQYVPPEYADPANPTEDEKHQMKLCKRLPQVLADLNRTNETSILRTKRFLMAFSHTVMCSYISKTIVSGDSRTADPAAFASVDFSQLNTLLGTSVVGDHASVLFSKHATTSSTTSTVNFLSKDVLQDLSNSATQRAKKVYRKLTTDALTVKLKSLTPLSPPEAMTLRPATVAGGLYKNAGGGGGGGGGGRRNKRVDSKPPGGGGGDGNNKQDYKEVKIPVLIFPKAAKKGIF
jgi:hypothetical protein